jgi:hypothetical protein
MRSEHDLRSALRLLERETPDTGQVLSQVAQRTSPRAAATGRRRGRRVLAGAAAAATVIAIAVTAALLVSPLRGRTAPPDASSVPRYYMALVPFSVRSYEEGLFSGSYAVVKDRITGRTVATVRPPRPYLGFIAVTGAADDRTFVLTARLSETYSNQPVKFFYARLNPANGAVTLTPLALPGLPATNFYNAVLSPNGTKLAVAGYQMSAGITVYSLPSGTAKTWSANVHQAFPYPVSWSRTGTLAFGWIGTISGTAGAAYLLNTNRAGGSLLADSRKAFCPVQPRVPDNIIGMGTNAAFLTPDGKTFISGVAQPIPVGERPPACTSRGLLPTMPELEEFSVSTGRATSVLYASASPSHRVINPVGEVYWSNPSGSVLVVAPARRTWQGTYGILTGSTFTPIPRASYPQLFDIAF